MTNNEPDEKWADENPMDWITMLIVSSGVFVFLAQPEGVLRDVNTVAFGVVALAGLYGSAKTLNTNE